MAEETKLVEVKRETQVEAPTEATFASPPPAPVTVTVEADPRARLLELVRELRRDQSRKLLAEYMRLRRGLAA